MSGETDIEPTWFTLDDIQPVETEDKLYCIGVDSPEKQFLAGRMGVPTHNTEEGKMQSELKGEAAMIIGSIARLGRAAGVHLVIATQRPDATIIKGETKANLAVRINAGHTGSTASSMILDSGEGTRVKPVPPGRLYVSLHGNGDHGQGFFTPNAEWIDKWLESKGLNPDGTPLSTKRSRLAKVTDMSKFEGGDLDTQEGVDNAGAIERIRQEEGDDLDFENAFAEEPSDEDMKNISAVPDDPADEWDFDDDDSDDELDGTSEDAEDSPKAPVDKMGRPELSKKVDNGDKFRRAEDDWDEDLEELIAQNSFNN